MIQEIVDHINDIMLLDLAFLDSEMKHGLAERIQETSIDKAGTETTIIYPAEYCGKDELTDLSDFDKRQGLLYHRLISPVTTSEGDDNIVGCDMQLVKEYPMRMVAYVKKTLINDFQYSDIQLAESLSNLVSSSNVFALNGILNADIVTIVPVAYNTDRWIVWAEETDGIAMKINFDYSLVAVNYTVTVTADSKCFVNLCDPVNQAYLT